VYLFQIEFVCVLRINNTWRENIRIQFYDHGGRYKRDGTGGLTITPRKSRGEWIRQIEKLDIL
jgi:hypothetical protein